MGAVELTVSDLERSVEFWSRSIGLDVLERGAGRASLGAGASELLALVEVPGARPSVRQTGLYHLALLLPDRVNLARWLAHAARTRVPLVGLSDHTVSEAVYLDDPDRHGIEIYADRPRKLWDGRVAESMTTTALDVDNLFGELEDPRTEPFDGLPAGTTMGHVHLRVARIPETLAFYRDLLGFGEMATMPTAAFLSAGGYHHHIGANTCESLGAPPAPPGTASLQHATILLPDAAERDRLAARLADAGQEPEEHAAGPLVRDPFGNRLVLAAAA
jgi:catechol 2,3-dioxygenase